MNSASLKILRTKIWWKVYEIFTSAFDFLLCGLNFPVSQMVKPTENNYKRIVFVGELLPPRTPRMAKWIKRSGNFSVILVCSKRGFVKKFSDPSFDAVYLFRNKWHLKRILLQIPDIWLIHSFAPKSYYPDIARQTLDVPFIHDMQDVYVTYYGLNPTLRWLKKELPHEKACLANADGVIAHSLEPNAGFRKYKIKKRPPTLFFPLYCDNDFFCENKKNLDPENIHLVYAGGVAGSHRNPKQYGNIQFQKLITTLTQQKIHFHIYPSPSNIRADYEEYEQTAKHNSYFHFHEPVAQQELAKELSQYHFGILPFFRELSQQSDDKLKYATTLKLFNYLEAGIPILVSNDLGYQSWMVERFASGFAIEQNQLADIRKLLANKNYSELNKSVVQSRGVLSLKKNIQRLIFFYQSVSSIPKSRHK